MVTVSIDITPADLAAISLDLNCHRQPGQLQRSAILPRKAKKVKEDWAKKSWNSSSIIGAECTYGLPIGGANKKTPSRSSMLTASGPDRLSLPSQHVVAHYRHGPRSRGDDNAKFGTVRHADLRVLSHERSGGVSVVSGDVVNKGILPRAPLLELHGAPRDQGRRRQRRRKLRRHWSLARRCWRSGLGLVRRQARTEASLRIGPKRTRKDS